MKFVLSRLGAFVCASLIAACASSGNRAIKNIDQESATAILQRGVSTKADVVRTFGNAKINKFDSGYEVWTYRYTEVTPKMQSLIPIVGAVAGGSNEHTRELVILFNPAGVVTKVRVRDGLNED
jgi:hypothetical protein